MIQTQCLELFVSCIPLTTFAQGWFLHFIIIWYNLNNLQTTIKNYRNNRKLVIVKINNVPVQLHTLACSDWYPYATHEICWKWMKMISIKRTHQTTAVANRPGYLRVLSPRNFRTSGNPRTVAVVKRCVNSLPTWSLPSSGPGAGQPLPQFVLGFRKKKNMVGPGISDFFIFCILLVNNGWHWRWHSFNRWENHQ